jgi:hypothetical protein
MNELNLPHHIIDRIERRWAPHLAKDAHAWMNEKAERPQTPRTVISKTGRLVPVSFKSRPLRGAGDTLAQRIA